VGRGGAFHSLITGDRDKKSLMTKGEVAQNTLMKKTEWEKKSGELQEIHRLSEVDEYGETGQKGGQPLA